MMLYLYNLYDSLNILFYRISISDACYFHIKIELKW